MDNDLLGRVTEVLNDPAQLSQVFALAKTLGLPVEPPQPNDSPPKQTSNSPPSLPEISPEALLFALRDDPREQALLAAVRAYCSEPRCRRLERALRIARVSRAATVLLQGFRERSDHV